MPKFSELTTKEKREYFKEIQEGKRIPSDNIFMSSILIIPEGKNVDDFMRENERDIAASFFNKPFIVLPSNGREIE